MFDRDEMRRESAFYYRCGQCGICCRDKVITLSPYDVMRMARAACLSTGEVIARYTLRRGSLLRFEAHGACSALHGALCALHSGRPLACRLYPLGIERRVNGERFVRLRRPRARSAFTEIIKRSASSSRFRRFSLIWTLSLATSD